MTGGLQSRWEVSYRTTHEVPGAVHRLVTENAKDPMETGKSANAAPIRIVNAAEGADEHWHQPRCLVIQKRSRPRIARLERVQLARRQGWRSCDQKHEARLSEPPSGISYRPPLLRSQRSSSAIQADPLP